jgi:geranylgeranyl transferase type-1 subunit beta
MGTADTFVFALQPLPQSMTPDSVAEGQYGAGFKPSSYMYIFQEECSEFDAPHMITTYTALLCLSILRDDFSRLDRPGLTKFLRASQREDGRYAL